MIQFVITIDDINEPYSERGAQATADILADLDWSPNDLVEVRISAPGVITAGIQQVYELMRDSFELAALHELELVTMDASRSWDSVRRIITTVDDAVGNHWDELEAVFQPEGGLGLEDLPDV